MDNNFADRKVIWSADELPPDAILDIVKSDTFPRDLVAIKLDQKFFIEYGLHLIDVLQDEFGVPVFADAKITEIPSKILGIAELYLKHHPGMLNIMANSTNSGYHPTDGSSDLQLKEKEILYQFANLCRASGTLPCAVTVLTSKSKAAVQLEYNNSVENQVKFYAALAEDCGLTDVVCSAHEAKVLRDAGIKLTINTPSIRFAESSTDDQARFTTPGEATMNGSNRLIAGRIIHRKGQPLSEIPKNVNRLLAEIDLAEKILKGEKV